MFLSRFAGRQLRAADVAQLSPKPGCCRSRPRCLRCPVVVAQMQKLVASDVGDRELEKALRKVRQRR
ncbi:hypothetical protein OCS65_04780 [Rhodococcus aetherivorans]|uniref:Uncharacterized protein n=1 Tax=Rhodococcus aetherivorans TaxID=191292 RepID=A0AA46PWU8_9NOCA|nr:MULTISPECIES: hypothetical protein [Rhodococcus]QIX52312.1 hypothetical protein HFP48_24190 [Rhodococcus sp. DMU1]UYF95096.1 hypothetical protein OCS65_04780 [Rhodococcus aetherivorans]